MNSYLVKGNRVLSGNIKVSGSKNSLLAILAACCIDKGIITLKNVAPLQDTYSMIRILNHLNIRVMYDHKNTMIVDSRNIKITKLDIKEIKDLRASYYFMGALMSVSRKLIISSPGGCKFSDRPIDLHLYAFEKLGIDWKCQNNCYYLKKVRKHQEVIEFKKVSVGATINAILASVKLKGKVKLINVASEVEVDDLINFLNQRGADIRREENSILINGVSSLSGCEYEIIDDRIEAQTFLVIGALIGKNLKIIYKNKNHIESLLKLFKELHVDIKEVRDGFIINKINIIKSKNIIFDVYPFLPTDIQPILTILFTKSRGESVFVDNVYPSRFSQVNELVSMGFNIKKENEKLIIRKNNSYLSSEVECKDLRGGASLVVAALLSDKTTKILNINHIKRGYFGLDDKLRKVGAYIEEI